MDKNVNNATNHKTNMGASSGVMVSKLDYQTFLNEFVSHWVPHSYGFVPHLSKILWQLLWQVQQAISCFCLEAFGVFSPAFRLLTQFLPSSGRVDTAIWMPYMDAN